MDKVKIIKQFDDGNNVQKWFIHQNDGSIVNLSSKLDLDISQCDWLDNDHRFLVVMYHEWDSSEHFAIVDNSGDIVKRGVREIREYVKEHNLFVLRFSGFGIGEAEARYYSIEPDDWKMGVVRGSGEFVIEPVHDSIVFDADQQLFIVDGEHRFDLDGKSLRTSRTCNHVIYSAFIPHSSRF